MKKEHQELTEEIQNLYMQKKRLSCFNGLGNEEALRTLIERGWTSEQEEKIINIVLESKIEVLEKHVNILKEKIFKALEKNYSQVINALTTFSNKMNDEILTDIQLHTVNKEDILKDVNYVLNSPLSKEILSEEMEKVLEEKGIKRTYLEKVLCSDYKPLTKEEMDIIDKISTVLTRINDLQKKHPIAAVSKYASLSNDMDAMLDKIKIEDPVVENLNDIKILTKYQIRLSDIAHNHVKMINYTLFSSLINKESEPTDLVLSKENVVINLLFLLEEMIVRNSEHTYQIIKDRKMLDDFMSTLLNRLYIKRT